MKLKKAKEYIKNLNKEIAANTVDMSKLARTFIDGDLREEIESATEEGGRTVNVQVPWNALGNMKVFVSACKNILTPLGFTCEESHDGGGMYTTLFVSW